MGRRCQELCRQGSLSLSGAGATIATAVEQRYASFCCVVSIELLQVLAHLASRAISSRARSPLLTKLLLQVPRVSLEHPSLSLSQVLKIHLRGLWWKMWGFVQASFSFGLHSFIVFGAVMPSSMYSYCRCAGASCCGPSHRRPRLSSLMTRAPCCPRLSIFQCCTRETVPHRRDPTC